ncbi:MAG: putative toxin-antitoxin system toxin component, PIN family [Bacteroidales bacterium]|nr:putative toxin-antitoxin system toxin component, PIN family [Candidatus Colicola equi]
MIYAVIDTNVLVSALMAKNDDATVRQVVNAIIDGKIIPMYVEEIINEYMEVLSRPQFHFPSELCAGLIARIKKYGVSSERASFQEVMQDESDRVFYEVALSRDDAYLVTGNLKHFPKAPIVVTPAQMLDIIRQQEA